MKIHFICRANVFRSRLAEGYLKSKKINNIEVSSSGVEAKNNLNGSISWEAKLQIKLNHLDLFAKSMWDQTNEELLNNADMLIFMDVFCFNKANEILLLENKNYQIWDIVDLLDIGENPTDERLLEQIHGSKRDFDKIVTKIDELITSLNL